MGILPLPSTVTTVAPTVTPLGSSAKFASTLSTKALYGRPAAGLTDPSNTLIVCAGTRVGPDPTRPVLSHQQSQPLPLGSELVTYTSAMHEEV